MRPVSPVLAHLQANDTINMLEAEVDELQAELAATQAVAAKHQRTAAASGQEIKVLQRLSSSGDISFMRTHSQTGRRSTIGHRYSEQGIPSFGSHDDLVHLQVIALKKLASGSKISKSLLLKSAIDASPCENGRGCPKAQPMYLMSKVALEITAKQECLQLVVHGFMCCIV